MFGLWFVCAGFLHFWHYYFPFAVFCLFGELGEHHKKFWYTLGHRWLANFRCLLAGLWYFPFVRVIFRILSSPSPAITVAIVIWFDHHRFIWSILVWVNVRFRLSPHLQIVLRLEVDCWSQNNKTENYTKSKQRNETQHKTNIPIHKQAEKEENNWQRKQAVET